MGDYFTSFAPLRPKITQSKAIGFKLIHWLIKEGIVVNELSDCTLGNLGYAPGENYQSVLVEEDPRLIELRTNGVEVFTERTVFHNGGYELDHVRCPQCNTDLSRTSWSAALNEWMDDSGEVLVDCSNCGSRTAIENLQFQPAWGFSNLGLTFWNWTRFKNTFVQDLEQKIGSPVRVIYGKI